MNRYYLSLKKMFLCVYKNDESGKPMSFKYSKDKDIEDFKTFISFDLDNRYFIYDNYATPRFINTCKLFKEKSLVCGRSYNFATKLKSFIEIILIDYIKDDKSEIVFLVNAEVIQLIEKFTKQKYRKVIQDVFNDINQDYKDQDCRWELKNVLKYEEVLSGLTRVLSARHKRSVCILDDENLYLHNYDQCWTSILGNKLSEGKVEYCDSKYDEYLKTINYPLSGEVKESLYNYIRYWEDFVNANHELFIVDEKAVMYVNETFMESDEYNRRLDSLVEDSRNLLKDGNYLFHIENSYLYYKEAFESLVKEGCLENIENYDKTAFIKDTLKLVDFIVKTNTDEFRYRYRIICSKYKKCNTTINDELNYCDNTIYYGVRLLDSAERRQFFKEFGITKKE